MTPVGGHKIEPVTPCCNEQSIELSAKCASSHSPVRLFVTLWTVARQAPLFMGILQARVLEWVATPFSISSGSSSSNYDPSYYPTKKKTCGVTPRKCLRSQCLTHTCPTIWAHTGGTAGLGGSQQQAGPDGKGPWYPGRSLGGCPLPSCHLH